MKTENQKLELHHIAGYLPEIKFYHFDDEREINSICRFSSISEDEITIFNSNYEYSERIEDVIPILRPLSDLTKEITHNGETFAPILKVLELLKIKYTSYTLLHNSVDLVLDWNFHKGNSNSREPQKVRFWLNTFDGIGFYCTNMGLFMYKDILGALDLLKEWHIDYQDLIGKGLAISYEELENLK